jgi:tetraprenyl-beta-curcumene synthase
MPIPDYAGHNRLRMQIACLYALYPAADTKSAAAFISSLVCIAGRLKVICSKYRCTDEVTVHSLYQPLADAVDPEGDMSGHLLNLKAEDSRYLEWHVQECRRQISEVPSYSFVAGKIKKYIQLYTDLEAYRVLPVKIREDYLKTWSGYYLLRSPDISWWEFPAASESLLSVFALYTAAFDPLLMNEDVRQLEAAYFPWVTGLQTLLEHYMVSRYMHEGRLNYTDYYCNLKACEERIAVFVERAANGCKDLNNQSFHINIVKILSALYLSDPRSFFGMQRLSSLKLLEKSLNNTRLYFHICKTLRFLGVV